MSSQNPDTLALEGVPDVASPVVIATKENTTRDGEGDGGDSAKDVVVGEGVELAISAYIEETARCII